MARKEGPFKCSGAQSGWWLISVTPLFFFSPTRLCIVPPMDSLSSPSLLYFHPIPIPSFPPFCHGCCCWRPHELWYGQSSRLAENYLDLCGRRAGSRASVPSAAGAGRLFYGSPAAGLRQLRARLKKWAAATPAVFHPLRVEGVWNISKAPNKFLKNVFLKQIDFDALWGPGPAAVLWEWPSVSMRVKERESKIGIFSTVYWVMWQQRTLQFITCGMTAIHKLWYFKPF